MDMENKEIIGRKIEEAKGRRHKILVVEDNEGGRKKLAGILRSEGYEVSEDCHGGLAVERLEKGDLPDLMTTDLCMPFMDGFELISYLESKGYNFPIIVNSEYDKEEIPIYSGRLRRVVEKNCAYGNGSEEIKLMIGEMLS